MCKFWFNYSCAESKSKHTFSKTFPKRSEIKYEKKEVFSTDSKKRH